MPIRVEHLASTPTTIAFPLPPPLTASSLGQLCRRSKLQPHMLQFPWPLIGLIHIGRLKFEPVDEADVVIIDVGKRKLLERYRGFAPGFAFKGVAAVGG
ncbi:hypothetical protein V6N13_110017 [Hibiscus sabdariffa]|uniref:Uncharacterized protein n=2 Tax=Hibiscus sabdariffa TaxID=183260 RepID=A0ABR2AGM6_9ROSI